MDYAISDEVTEKLRDAILSGEYFPNERLVEDDLAMKFQTSRTPVREAIRNLANVELIKIVPKKGAVVAEIDVEEIKDIYVVRANLEALASKLAVKNIPNEVIPEMEEMIEEMESSITKGDKYSFGKWNMEFHITIYRYCENKLLYGMIKDLLDRSVLFRRSSWESQRHLKLVMKSHRELLNAIIERDADKAQRVAEEHIKLFINNSLVINNDKSIIG